MAGCSAPQNKENGRYQYTKIKDIQQEIDFSACFVKSKFKAYFVYMVDFHLEERIGSDRPG